MSWLDSALDEMGLGPRWVRRGQGAAPAAAGEGEASADAVVTARSERVASPASDRPVLASPPRADADETLDERTAERVDARADVRLSQAVPSESHRPAPGTAPSGPGSPDMVARAPDAAPVARGEASALDRKAATDEAQPVAASSVADLGWDELEARVAECQRCLLCEKRTQTVFGVGDREADWMLVGEAPGENEDKQGEPFVGQAGKLLDSMLQALSLERSNNVYIANVIKCRPPGNRNPEPDEVARCEPYLQRQVALVKPKLIVALGRFAAQTLLKSDGSIASMRGRVHQYEGVPVIVSYHPAYLLRSLPDKSKAWADLCLARDTFGKSTGGA
ncbi:MAG: uracil-DNA glycosylase [Burkholderia sp.]